MRLERLHEHLTTVTAVIIGGVVSYWFGLLAGEGSVGTILAIIAGFCLTGLLLALRQHVWVLIPLTWQLTGVLQLVTLHPALRDVVVFAVLASTFMLMAVKAVRIKPERTSLDFWLWTICLYLLVTWVRHPTGGLVLSSDRIGGRPYVNVVIGLAAWFVLARAFIPRSWDGNRLLQWMVGFLALPGLAMAAAFFSASIGSHIAVYYSGIASEDAEADGATADSTSDAAGRKAFMQVISYPFLQWMIVALRPLSLLNPLLFGRFLFFGLLLLATMMAGFRSAVFALVGMMMIASYLRRGPIEVLRLGFLLLGAATVLTLSSYVYTWPLAVQRALSTLPGRWDSVVLQDAQHSVEWRVFMWREMLLTDHYIQNRWIGDGFGFTLEQYTLMMSPHVSADSQENLLIVGQVHSGPITAIRYLGYVGLILYLCLVIAVAREALRLCRLSRATNLGPLTWFLCLPMIWEPIQFVFIFSSIDIALPTQIVWIGLLKMLRRSIEMRQARPEAPVLPARRAPRVDRPALAGRQPLPMTVPLP